MVVRVSFDEYNELTSEWCENTITTKAEDKTSGFVGQGKATTTKLNYVG